MPCNCDSDSAGVFLQEGPGVDITGDGSELTPWTVGLTSPSTPGPRFKVAAAALQSIPNSTETDRNLATVLNDSHAGYNTSSDRYTIPVGWGGLWLFTASVRFASNATGNRSLRAITSNADAFTFVSAAVTAEGRMNATVVAQLAAGQVAYSRVSQSSGAALDTTANAGDNWFAGTWLGP